MIFSTAGSASLGIRFTAVYYLNEQKATIETSSTTQHCLKLLAAYTLSNMVNCALAKFILPSSSCSVIDLSIKAIMAGF
ncbi:MAG: hypothetical protein WBJ81_00265 [Rickettsiales bacterium]